MGFVYTYTNDKKKHFTDCPVRLSEDLINGLQLDNRFQVWELQN